MAYVTFEYYQDVYHGKQFSNTVDFEAVQCEAEAYVDRLTMGRITEPSEPVKKAVCAVMEVIAKQEQDEVATVSSETVGNHSKTFQTVKRSAAEREAEKYRKASLYLARTGLLYRGLRPT